MFPRDQLIPPAAAIPIDFRDGTQSAVKFPFDCLPRYPLPFPLVILMLKSAGEHWMKIKEIRKMTEGEKKAFSVGCMTPPDGLDKPPC